MSISNQLFPILVDENGVSYAPREIVEGDASAAKEGLLGFSFKDASGNAVLPQLNNEGAIVVSQDGGTTLRNYGELLEGAQTKDVESQVAEIDLTAAKLYSKISFFGAGTRLAKLRMAYVDDAGGTPAETTLGVAILGAGETNVKWDLNVDLLDTTGGTGDQKLRVYATPLENKLSDLFVSVSANEIP